MQDKWQAEIIVIDDGSTDDTREILDPYIEKGQVIYLQQPNIGKAAATRKGVMLATGEVVFNLDADDYFLPGKINETIRLFQEYPSLVHVSSPARIVYEDGRAEEMEQIPSTWLDKPQSGLKLLQSFFEKKLLFGGGSCFAARTSVLKTIEWNDQVDMYIDEWLLIETLLKGDSFIMSEPLSVWRVHGRNYSGSPTGDRQGLKQQRMEKSSATILQLLESGAYPNWLKKLYRLKHEVRKMAWKEERHEKSLADIGRFFKNAILSGNNWSVLRRYHAFNRLLPTAVLKWLKK